ncbi:MAG: ATP-binding protein, partial [Anaerolineales bacterium]|nr:ATP-binding protein [Anaerolineales bacterium]
FLKDAQTYDVLAFLAIETHGREPAVSQVAAGMHTLGTSESRDDQLTAVTELEKTIASHPDWRWATSMSAIYHSLQHVLQAKSLEDILDIPPVDKESTASLPTNIVQSVRHMNAIIDELHKVERVDDLRTKIIFLENSLKAMRDALAMLQKIGDAEEDSCTPAPPPENKALQIVLVHWQSIVLEAIERMKGRAAVTCVLKNERSPLAAQVPLVYEVANNGLNVAQKVRLRVQENGGYHLLQNGNSDVYIDILPPGETRQVTMAIAPTNGQRRLRVEWLVSYDDAVDANRELEFADVLEFVDPDKPFERIFPIPYVTGTPLKSDDVFVGREDVFAFIRENLLGTHQNNVIILHGQRRTGKTSVLYRLGRVMADTHHAVLIDMQGKPARGAAEFLYSIADDIVFMLEEYGIEVEMPEREDFEEAPEFFFRNRFLRQIKPHLEGKNLLLLFDEFEELQRRVEDGRLSPDIFTFLRNLMQHEEHLDFVFSGTHKLEELGAEYWSVLFNIAVYKPITFLSPNEVRRLVTEPIAQYNLEYDPLAVQKIARVTAGHPYFTQLVLHEALVYHNETERNYLTVTDVDQILRRIVERGEAHFKYIWAESSPEAQTILRALTECLISTDAVSLKQLQKFLADRWYEWDETWEVALRSLLDRDILARGAIGSSLFRFKVDLIRLWIEQTRPPL